MDTIANLPEHLARRYGTQRPAATPRVKVVIEVDAARAPALVAELCIVGATAPSTGERAVLAACSTARIEGSRQ